MKKEFRIYLKFTDGYVKLVHIIEEKNLIKISLDQHHKKKIHRYNEITIHDTKTHIKDLHYNKFKDDNNPFFVGDIPENNGYPYETTLNGRGVGYINIPENLILPIFTQIIMGVRESDLLPEMNKKGQVIELTKSSSNRFILKISFTKNQKYKSIEEGDKMIIETKKGNIIFEVT